MYEEGHTIKNSKITVDKILNIIYQNSHARDNHMQRRKRTMDQKRTDATQRSPYLADLAARLQSQRRTEVGNSRETETGADTP